MAAAAAAAVAAECVPPTTFVAAPLSKREQQRRDLLCGFVGTRAWWQELFDDGCFMAGGAALFVVDDRQCVGKVGDVDVWVPPQCGDKLTNYVTRLYEWMCEHDLEVRIAFKHSVVTVWNERLPVQFIKVASADPRRVLANFDVDCVQCAVTQSERVLSLACATAHRTRVVKWLNERKWQFKGLPPALRQRVQAERGSDRKYKLVAKGFRYGDAPYNGMAPPPTPAAHDCAPQHRDVNRMCLEHPSDCGIEFSTMTAECVRALEKVRAYRRRRVWTLAELQKEYADVLDETTQSWSSSSSSSSAVTTLTTTTTSAPRTDETSVEAVARRTRSQKRKAAPIGDKVEATELDVGGGRCNGGGATGGGAMGAEAKRGRCSNGDDHDGAVAEYDWKALVPMRAPFSKNQFDALRQKYEKALEQNDTHRKRRYWFGVRNLDLLQDVDVPLAEVRASVQSDALKCGVNAQGMGLGLLLCALGPRRSELEQAEALYADIREYFFAC